MQTLWYFARDSWVGLDCHLVNNDRFIRFGFKHTVFTGLSSGTWLWYGPLHVFHRSPKILMHLYDTVSAIRYLLLSSPIRIMWLYILTLIILWTFFWYPWICPAAHHHSRGDWKERNKFFSFICISQGICTWFHLFCRVYTTNPYCTHVINPYFQGLSSMQCGARTTVELSVKHDMGEFDNKTTTTKQINRAQNIHNLHNFQVILHIYMAYSQLMMYQLYEQNICVCIFIRTKMMMSFPFIKRVSILTARQNIQHDEDMTNIFYLRILLV